MSALKNQQHSTCFDRSRDIFVAKYVIDRTCRWHRSARTLDGFHVLTKGCDGIRDPFLHRLAGRETSLDVRKPDAEGAIRLLFDDSHIMHRVGTPHHSQNNPLYSIEKSNP